MKLIQFRAYLLMIVMVVAVTYFACDEHFLTEFQTETDFNISDFDRQACNLLSADTVRVDTVINGPDTTFTETRLYHPVSLAYLSDDIVEDWVNTSDSLISALFDTLLADTTCVVRNPEQREKGYTLFQQNSGGTSTVVLFTSWELNELNSSAYINIDLINNTGEKMTLKTNSMDLETVAGCSQTFEVSGSVVTLPSIRSRLTFALPEGTYLVRCFLTKPDVMTTFRMVIF